jgi:hypothetical protein
MERLLNDLLMGKAPDGKRPEKAGFILIGLQKPASMSGKQTLSTAISRRVTTSVLPEHPQDELTAILINAGLNQPEAQQLTAIYQEQREHAKSHHLSPAPNLQDLLRHAKSLIDSRQKSQIQLSAEHAGRSSTATIELTRRKTNLPETTSLRMLKAAENKRWNEVEIMLDTNPIHLDRQDKNASQLLMKALKHNKLNIALKLTSAGARLEEEAAKKLFSRAIKHNNQQLIKSLLDIGINANQPDSTSRYSPIIRAATNHCWEIVDLLLDTAGINVNIANSKGYSLLLLLYESGKLTLAEKLLSKEVDIDNLFIGKANLLHIVASRYNEKVMHQLLSSKYIQKINDLDEHLKPPVLIAAEVGNWRVVHEMLKYEQLSLSPEHHQTLVELAKIAQQADIIFILAKVNKAPESVSNVSFFTHKEPAVDNTDNPQVTIRISPREPE